MVNAFVKDWVFYFISDSTAFSSSHPHAFQINFNSLYTALCEQQKSDQATLLLYMLLHQNSNVRTYVLARTDIENLVSIALLALYSSWGGGPGSWGVTSCQCPLFLGGGSRFWLTYSPVLAHLFTSILSSQEYGAKRVTAVKDSADKATRLSLIPSFSVPLSDPGPTCWHGVKKLVAAIILFIILFFFSRYSGQKVTQAYCVCTGITVNKMSCNLTNMPNVLQGWPEAETPQGAADRFYRNTTAVTF